MKRKSSPMSVLVALNKSIISRTKKLGGIFRAVSETGAISLRIMDDGSHLTPEYVDRELADGVEGFIVGAFNIEDAVHHISRLGIPMAAIFALGKRRRNACEIRTDNRGIAREAARIFLGERACNSFAYYPATGDPDWSQEREREFRRAIKAGSGAPCVTLSRTSAAEQLCKLPRPVGVFAANDTYAVKVLNDCRENGLRVPKDVSIVGVDNEEFLCESVSPALTSIEPDFEREGYEAAKALFNILSGRNQPGTIICGFRQVVFRKSTFDANHGANLVARAIEYIDRNATSGISVADVCAYLKVSRRLLDLRFRELKGFSPVQAIVSRRLETLRKMLKSSKLPISLVCKRCGFGSENHPKKLFRMRYGMSMRDFRAKVVAAAVALAVAMSASAEAGAARFSISADRADCLYSCGETAAFTVTAAGTNGAPLAEGRVVATLDDFGTNQMLNAAFDLKDGNPFVVRGTMAVPGFLKLAVKMEDGTNRPSVYGVGFEPGKIRKASPSPPDFDSFWEDAKRRLDETTPADVALELVPERCTASIDFHRISVASYKGRVWGYLSLPKDASAAKKYPVRVEVPGAGKGRWAHDMTPANDAICLKMTAHAFPLAFDDETFLRQYADLEKEVREKYAVANYSVAGLGKSREEFYYYRAFLGISRAVDWIVSQPYADARSVTYSGASQGGGFGLALLALNHRFTKGVLFVPALTDNMAPLLVGRRSGCGPCHIFGQPKEDQATAAENAPYFDGANFASRIACPVRVVVGFADDVCPPPAIYATYNEIKSPDRKIIHGIGMGHHVSRDISKQMHDWLRQCKQSAQ